MTLREQIAADLALHFDEDHFAERADYQSAIEGLKSQILVVKEEIEGGVTDQQHTRQNVRLANFRVLTDLATGVVQPAEGDTLKTVEAGETITWTLARNGIVERNQGEHVLKFTTITQLKQGRKGPNSS